MGGCTRHLNLSAPSAAGAGAFGPAVVTAEFKINYLRPAIGDAIVARAEVVYAGKTQAVWRCDLFASRAGQETLCAVAQGTITRLSQPSTD